MVLTAGGPCVGQEKRRRHEGDDEADQFCGAVTSHKLLKCATLGQICESAVLAADGHQTC